MELFFQEKSCYYWDIPACLLSFGHVWLFVSPWAVAHQDPLSMGFSGQEYWSGLPFTPLGDLSDPGIDLVSPAVSALQVILQCWATREASCYIWHIHDVGLRCTMCWFDKFVYCNMITTLAFSSTNISHNYHC